MKGGGTSVLPLHAGLKFDLEQLLKLFKETNSARFVDFAECFKSMEFGVIFSGRQSHAELFEFSERLLQIAASYMMPTKKFGRRIAETSCYVLSTVPPFDDVDNALKTIDRIFGVYACFALFYLQPRDYFVQIRITPAQLDEVRIFLETVLIPENHADTVACLMKLTDDCAFKITCFPLSYDPVCHKRYDMADVEIDCVDELPPIFDSVREILEDPLLRQIEMIHKKYELGKETLNAYSHANRKDVANEIRSTVACELKRFEDQESRKNELAPEALANAMKKVDSRVIKDKAYSSQIKHSRNRRLADPEMTDNFDHMVNVMTSNALEGELVPKRRTGRGRKSKQSLEEADTVEPEASGDTAEAITQDLRGSKKTRGKKGDLTNSTPTPSKRKRAGKSADFENTEQMDATPTNTPGGKDGARINHEMGGNAGTVSAKYDDPAFEEEMKRLTAVATRPNRTVKLSKK